MSRRAALLRSAYAAEDEGCRFDGEGLSSRGTDELASCVARELLFVLEGMVLGGLGVDICVG